MDEGTRSIDRPSPATPETLSNEITTVRGELDCLLAELDRRRHEAFDVRLQLRRHGFGIALTGAAFLATGTGVVWLGMWRQQRRERLAAQAGRLQRAVSRMIDQPERVAAEPTIVHKIAAAAGSAAVASLVRKLLERGVEWVLERERATEPSPAQEEEFGPVRISKAA